MNVTFLPSLRHMALVKVATMMSTYSDFRPLLTNVKLYDGFFECQYIIDEKQLRILEDKTMTKLKSCELPVLLQKEVVYSLRPLCLLFLRWIERHEELMYTNVDLHWKSEGTIDEHKTAQGIIQNENIVLQKRFAVACKNALEADVLRLWNKMSESQEELTPHDLENATVKFWATWLEGGAKTDLRLKPLAFYFKCDPPEIGLNFFYQKLSVEERRQCITKILESEITYFTNFRFWIRDMDTNQKEKLFHEYPVWVVKNILDWPLQSVFMDVADHMWRYLTKTDFHQLMVIFLRKIEGGFRDFDYAELLRIYWQKSPIHFQEYVKKEAIYQSLLNYLQNK